MEVKTKKFNCKRGDSFNIYFIGDIHEGNINHAEDELKECVKIIKDDPNGYWVGMGDYIEAITIDDVKRFNPITIADKYKLSDLKDLPYRQLENVFKNLKPIEDKCLAILIGNHEEAYIKHNHADIYDRFATMFTVHPPKIGYVGFLKLKFNYNQNEKRGGKSDTSILIALNHGVGGNGMREGYPINKVHDLYRWTDADICVMGHIHSLAWDDKKVQSVNSNDNHSKRRKFFGITGCFLWTYIEGNTNYFENRGKSESDIGMLKATIKIIDKKPPFITMTPIKLG